MTDTAHGTDPAQDHWAGPDDLSVAAAELVTEASAVAVDCIVRSTVVQRLSAGSLPFAGRVAWLEQHWEGLRILGECPQLPVPARRQLAGATGSLHHALDRAHAGARWRDRHVTMPSMLPFRRHITTLREDGDLPGLLAQAHVRLLCTGIGSGLTGEDPAQRPTSGLEDLLCSLVREDEDLERLSEELSAGLLMFMQHGSDVCRTYQDVTPDAHCAVTVATIRGTLR